MSYADHLDPTRLTPGLLNPIAENIFYQGACSALAIALHDATGWPIVGVSESDNVHDGRLGLGSCMHFLVERPDGKLIDVLGAHDPEEVLDSFPAEYEDEESALGYARREDVVEQYEESAASRISLRAAARFVDAVLERARPAMEQVSQVEEPEISTDRSRGSLSP